MTFRLTLKKSSNFAISLGTRPSKIRSLDPRLLRHDGIVFPSVCSGDIGRGQNVVCLFPQAVQQCADLSLFSLGSESRGAPELFESSLPFGPVVGASKVESLGRLQADVGHLPTLPPCSRFGANIYYSNSTSSITMDSVQWNTMGFYTLHTY